MSVQVKGRVTCNECGATEEVWLSQFVGPEAPKMRLTHHIFPPDLPEGWVLTDQPPTAVGHHRCPSCAIQKGVS